MDEKELLLTTLLNDSLTMCGLPTLSKKKTKVYVKMNNLLKEIEIDKLTQLTDDYGLVLPALALADVNVDYAILLQNKQTIDIEGFIRYVDVWFVRTTHNRQPVMKHLTGIDKKPKETRQMYITQLLEHMINTKRQDAATIIQNLVERNF